MLVILIVKILSFNSLLIYKMIIEENEIIIIKIIGIIVQINSIRLFSLSILFLNLFKRLNFIIQIIIIVIKIIIIKIWS